MKLIKGLLFIVTLHLMIMVCRPVSTKSEGFLENRLKYSNADQQLPLSIPVYAESVTLEDNEDESGFDHDRPHSASSLLEHTFQFAVFKLHGFTSIPLGIDALESLYLRLRSLRI